MTAAKVRYLRLPGLAGEFALITLDNGHDHTRPSTFGPGGIASLDAALDEIAAHSPAPVAIGVTGKPFIFAVGADLSGVPSVTDAAQAREIAEAGHRVFRRLKDSAVPTFAFVNGVALGGGLELALHCRLPDDRRRPAMVAFPEVFLGLVPGWGGTQLLPNLIGIDPAVTVIVENALAQNKMIARRRRRRSSASPTPSSSPPTSWSARWSGRSACSPATSPSRVPRSTVGLGRRDRAGARDRRRRAPATPPPAPCAPSSCSTWRGPASTATRSPPAPRPRTTRSPTC